MRIFHFSAWRYVNCKFFSCQCQHRFKFRTTSKLPKKWNAVEPDNPKRLLTGKATRREYSTRNWQYFKTHIFRYDKVSFDNDDWTRGGIPSAIMGRGKKLIKSCRKFRSICIVIIRGKSRYSSYVECWFRPRRTFTLSCILSKFRVSSWLHRLRLKTLSVHRCASTVRILFTVFDRWSFGGFHCFDLDRRDVWIVRLPTLFPESLFFYRSYATTRPIGFLATVGRRTCTEKLYVGRPTLFA